MVQVYIWGDISAGPSGLQTAFSPVSWTVPGTITEIHCGNRHVLFLTEDGTVLSCGHNSEKLLGRSLHGDEKILSSVEGISDAVSLACGPVHSLVVSSCGRVYSWGEQEDGQLGISIFLQYITVRPSRVLIPPALTVIQVACGTYHSLALTKGGDVLSWGSNSHGQLGLGKDVPMCPIPALMGNLTGVAVAQISAGATHSLFLTLPGLVYCCGANKYGQLGLNRVDEKGRFNICMVPALRPLGVSFISCGEAHSAVLTADGEVFTFGWGGYGQLGHSSSADEWGPRRVEGLGGPSTQISCGRRHTLVLGSSGRLWAFGNGTEGQLGTGKPDDSLIPTLVDLPWVTDEATATPEDLKILAGCNTSFIYTSSTKSLERRQITGRLAAAKLQKWLAMKNGDQESKSEIISMFLTGSSLVASFTKAGGLPVEAGASTVDVEAACQAFDQMLATPWIKETINLSSLINVLEASRSNIKSPEIFLILPTCRLLQEDSSVIGIVMPLAGVISAQNEKNQKTLKDWWSSLTPALLERFILVFKNALAFMLKNRLSNAYNPGTKFLMDALKLLYKANKVGKSYKVSLSTFYVMEIINNVDPVTDVSLWFQYKKLEDDSNTPTIFCRYPFLLPLVCKAAMFNIFAFITKVRSFTNTSQPILQEWAIDWIYNPERNDPESSSALTLLLCVRRDHMVEDTFRQLAAVEDCAFKKELVVKFTDERKLMQVNRRDLFLYVFDKLNQPESEMFMFNEKKTLMWFPPSPKQDVKPYFLFGVLCGLALYNQNIVYLPFPLVLFKKLLRLKPSLDDMKEFEPVVAKSWMSLLEDTPEEVESLEITFTVTWGGETVELDPTEKGKAVTASNSKEFVDAFVNHVFNESVAPVFEEFKRGFFKVCDMDMVDFFQPEELRDVMVGKDFFDWEMFKQNTVYEGEFHAEHLTILTFWEVFETLTEKEKKKFFLFITGCDRVPFQGMSAIKMRVAVQPESTELHMPTCITCQLLLLLPLYQRYPVEKTMRTRLLRAIHHNTGFWKDDTKGPH